MNSIAWVNIYVQSGPESIDYDSGESLRDYDIVVFDPEFPYRRRIEFSGGGSCITIEDTKILTESMSHWSREISGALKAGKTVFVLLNTSEDDQVSTGYTTGTRNTRTYNTSYINNYASVPARLNLRNAIGRRVIVNNPIFKNLYSIISDIAEYRVLFEKSESVKTAFTAKDGTVIGGIIKSSDAPGSLVLLPYFEFKAAEFFEKDSSGDRVWSKKALAVSNSLVGQLVAIDKELRNASERTPQPDWVSAYSMPSVISEINSAISDIDAKIAELQELRSEQENLKYDALIYANLLYETGKPLEKAIEMALQLLDYKVETLRIGDLEIDHVIVGPSGKRMIGEAEGKDSSAIDISKFRQLESNIGEDFERDEVDEPAKGLLFGNGFRLTDPSKRAEQFTDKSMKNAKRLGSALIQTSDLYDAILYILDNPKDTEFKEKCREAIENTVGDKVIFPNPLI